ncbi:MBL fold metallo-hydrolase [Myxosarcina sp. GI1(2024)]
MPQINPGIRNTKPPRLVLPQIFAFAPNRDTLGGTAYFIVNKSGNILLDSPAWNQSDRQFLEQHGGVRWWIFSHRGGIGKQVKQIQAVLHCEVILQEQEAYLLPEVEVSSFQEELSLDSNLHLIWTPGHSPGTSCLYLAERDGILFSSRHLLPKSPEIVEPLRTAKTFHWWRQLNSVAKLRDRFSADTLQYILPGANTGYLRGKGYIDNAYQCLAALDLKALKTSEPMF